MILDRFKKRRLVGVIKQNIHKKKHKGQRYDFKLLKSGKITEWHLYDKYQNEGYKIVFNGSWFIQKNHERFEW